MKIETILEDPQYAIAGVNIDEVESEVSKSQGSKRASYSDDEENTHNLQPNQECAEYIEAVEAIAQFAMVEMGLHEECELSIVIVDPEKMAELHEQWMDLEGPTDVLSFPMDEVLPHSKDEGPGVVGDIVLCPTFIIPQARENGKTIIQELSLLTVHGVLHCLGYDHRDKEEEREMFSLQDSIVENWFSKGAKHS